MFNVTDNNVLKIKEKKMNKTYQLYSVTNILNNKVYIAHSYQKVNPKSKYYSTNKSLYEDLKIYGSDVFRKDIICTADTQNDIKAAYRKCLLDYKNSNIELYNDMCSYGYIYLTTNLLNGMKYIGQHRISGNPKIDDTYYGSGVRISNVIKEEGVENFKREILEECDSEDELNEREQYWIKKYDAVNNDEFYNIAAGGEFGNIWDGKTEEERQRFSEIISKSNKTRKHDGSKISGDKNPAFGRHWYKDEVNHLQYYLYPDDPFIESEHLVLGMFRTKEHNMKISKAIRGKKRCPSSMRGRIAVHKEEITRYIDKSELDTYLKLGYTQGGSCRKTKNCVHMNNGSLNVFVDKNEVQKYLDKGYSIGWILMNKNT